MTTGNWTGNTTTRHGTGITGLATSDEHKREWQKLDKEENYAPTTQNNDVVIVKNNKL